MSRSSVSPLDQITVANASRLVPACIFQVGELDNFQTNPIVHNGTMFLTTRTSTIAIDAASCRERWRYTWQVKGVKDGSAIAVSRSRTVESSARRPTGTSSRSARTRGCCSGRVTSRSSRTVKRSRCRRRSSEISCSSALPAREQRAGMARRIPHERRLAGMALQYRAETGRSGQQYVAAASGSPSNFWIETPWLDLDAGSGKGAGAPTVVVFTLAR